MRQSSRVEKETKMKDWRERYNGTRTPNTEYLVGIAEAARYLGRCQATVYTYLRQGTLPGVVRDACTWCFSVQGLDEARLMF